jgi:hypothetical protein
MKQNNEMVDQKCRGKEFLRYFYPGVVPEQS